ncbi:MAG: 50S ribosomal protein L29 [Acidobacteriota bacterium]|jgi:large subunit ribosomal protein L29|nr:50S ribosomal protein L29 [Acidobacteriota bacterium]OQB56040.1 MAG: 50S ribosomal protein L29 [Candidatus Aminicenantes bacterium ADurb.Bin147]HNQ79538.1 50S ribosomal protein L29 [Candidatus Aminicenantes bacterium]MDD8010114.1 50S ribosomal protein L29 [Acidobacteriota bacterium]MDD8029745.1 50S ribosomal protein L29 [Acidobacteriota bacterium]
MKLSELRELSKDELLVKKAELKDQIFKLRFQHSLGQLESTAKLRNVRREIARIETLAGEKDRKAKAE